MLIAFLNNLFYAITSLIKQLFSSFLKTEIKKTKPSAKTLKVNNNEVCASLLVSFWYSTVNFEQISCHVEFWCHNY